MNRCVFCGSVAITAIPLIGDVCVDCDDILSSPLLLDGVITSDSVRRLAEKTDMEFAARRARLMRMGKRMTDGLRDIS